MSTMTVSGQTFRTRVMKFAIRRLAQREPDVGEERRHPAATRDVEAPHVVGVDREQHEREGFWTLRECRETSPGEFEHVLVVQAPVAASVGVRQFAAEFVPSVLLGIAVGGEEAALACEGERVAADVDIAVAVALEDVAETFLVRE